MTSPGKAAGTGANIPQVNSTLNDIINLMSDYCQIASSGQNQVTETLSSFSGGMAIANANMLGVEAEVVKGLQQQLVGIAENSGTAVRKLASTDDANQSALKNVASAFPLNFPVTSA